MHLSYCNLSRDSTKQTYEKFAEIEENREKSLFAQLLTRGSFVTVETRLEDRTLA